MFCPKCGKENSDQNTFCLYCGFKLVENGLARSKEKHIQGIGFLKNKNLIMIIVGILVIILVLALANQNPDKNGYFRNTKWGMTIEEVKVSEKNEKSDFSNYSKEKQMLFYETSNLPFFKGNNAGITFSFNSKGELIEGTYNLFLKDTDLNSNEYLDDLIEVFKKKYGSNYEKKDVYSSYIWTTSKSKIEIIYAGKEWIAINFEEN